MAISWASRTLHPSFLLVQSRALLISSWSKRRYSSSVPVRYIPKHTHIKIAQDSSSNENEVDLVRNNMSKTGRVPNLDDKKLRLQLSVTGIKQTSNILKQVEEFSEARDGTSPALELADTDSGVKSGLFLDDASTFRGNNNTDSNEVVISKIREDAENMAIKLLAARAFTAVELQKKLRGKKFPLNVIDSVITDMKGRGLLNDGLYAESFSQSRWLSSTWGPRRIKQALIQKGVSESEANEAMKQVFEDEDDPSDGSHYTQHGMSKLSMERLLLQASKQWLRGQDTPPEKRRLRIMRWLQYRGFNWGVTNFILKKLESQYPP